MLVYVGNLAAFEMSFDELEPGKLNCKEEASKRVNSRDKVLRLWILVYGLFNVILMPLSYNTKVC